MTGNAHAAEDLVQETFLRACRALHRFGPGGNGVLGVVAEHETWVQDFGRNLRPALARWVR